MDFQCVFWNGRTEKHQTSTARFRLAEENGQHRPFPSLACVLPHPLQNRVPRVQVLLPLPKCVSPDLAKTAWSGDFSCLNWSGYGLVFRPYVASGAILSHPSSTVFYRRHPLQHLERTRLRLFSPVIGCVSLFFLFWTCKISEPVFVHSAAKRYRLKSLVIPVRREVSFLT